MKGNGMPKISVIYISNRYGSLDILKSSLKRQTLQDFELVFVDGLYTERKEEVAEYFKDFKVKHIDQTVLPMEGGYLSKLARADNLAFKNCDGELIVCLQDYIYIPSTGLEKFWNLHKQYEGKALLTGKGHQYWYPETEEIVNPKGLITVFETDYTKKPEIKFWTDPRDNGMGVREAYPVEWEMNWAAIPRDIIYDLGGMDEQYDKEGFAWDNTNIATRAAFLGYKIYIDLTNECFGFNHDGWWPNPLKVNRVSPEKYHFEQMNKMMSKKIPVRLNYLS
jgi:glycosyltransferase involved in cell wall biosynthesis